MNNARHKKCALENHQDLPRTIKPFKSETNICTNM